MDFEPKTQAEMDEIMSVYGKARHDGIYRVSIDYKAETRTPAGRFALREAVGQLYQAFVYWDQECKGKVLPQALTLLRDVGYRQAALIAAQVVLDSFSIKRSYGKLARAIGMELEAEARFAYVQSKHRILWEALNREVQTKDWKKKLRVLRKMANDAQAEGRFEWQQDGWGRRERMRVGMVMLEMMAIHTGIISITRSSRHTSQGWRTELLVAPTPAAEEWMRKTNEVARSRTSFYLPMVEEPAEWEDLYDGGYRANVIRRVPLVKCHRDLRDEFTVANMPEVFRAVNQIQSVPWRLNVETYHTFDHLWREEGGEIADLPARDGEEIPPSPDPWVDGSKEVGDWKTVAHRIHRRNRELVGRRALVAKIGNAAKLFTSEQALYYPHKTDFRGRIYPIPTCGMTPQGCDIGKGLLLFDRADIVEKGEGRDWHSVHGANTWGMDKAPLEERIQWADDNAPMIRAIATDPLDCRDWAEADEPWQFLSWCLDRGRLLDAEAAGREYWSRLPVSQDATSSGLQLYSLLLRDPVAAAATNVSPSDTRQDIYQDVADVVTAKLREVADGKRPGPVSKKKDEWEDAQRYARNWLAFCEGRLPRAATKRPVMVLPYGGTLHSTRDYVGDWLVDELRKRGLRDNMPFDEVWQHSNMLGCLIWEGMREVVHGAVAGMEWIQNAARLVTDAGEDLCWTSPSGFVVKHRYRKLRTRDVRTTLGRRVIIKRKYTEDTDDLHRSRQVQASAPNFIHSLDAALLTITANRLFAAGVQDIGVVHDCYASHAATASQVGRMLREVTAEMFTPDLLGQFKTEVEDRAGVVLPDLPEYGDLDPQTVTQSLYYFS